MVISPFFKSEAARHGTQYQRMIRRLLDAYVDAFEPKKAEQPRERYRAARVPARPARKPSR